MKRAVGVLALFMGTAAFAVAGCAVIAPEIDPASGIAAIALLSGGLLVIRGRRKRQAKQVK